MFHDEEQYFGENDDFENGRQIHADYRALKINQAAQTIEAFMLMSEDYPKTTFSRCSSCMKQKFSM